MVRAPFMTLATLGWLAVLSPGLGARSPQRAGALEPTHAVRGIVRSIADTSLTIVGSGKRTGELTFVVVPATHREGVPRVGATVSVRYRRDGDRLLATAISAQPEKHDAAR